MDKGKVQEIMANFAPPPNGFGFFSGGNDKFALRTCSLVAHVNLNAKH
jgi:hypothetical protein